MNSLSNTHEFTIIERRKVVRDTYVCETGTGIRRGGTKLKKITLITPFVSPKRVLDPFYRLILRGLEQGVVPLIELLCVEFFGKLWGL